MNPLIPSPEFSLHRSATLSNDVEMLQTDVMRFFAILSLCLMAIFALVKALPMAPPADQPMIAQPADLRAGVQSLQKQIAMLKEKLAETQAQVRAASAAAQQSSSQAGMAARDEQEVLNRLLKTQQELQKASQSLSKTRAELKIREAKLDKTKEKLNQRLQQNQQPEKKLSDAQPRPQPTRKGFTLRFASDAALQKLIFLGKVNFYALTGIKAWQLHLTGGQPVFSPAKFPREIYEMETSTVPIDYAEAFHRQVAAFGRGSVTWGVTLPAQTTASINRLIAGRDGADLLIMPDGEVILN